MPKCTDVNVGPHLHTVNFALELLNLAAIRSLLAGVTGLHISPSLSNTVPYFDGKKEIVIES